MADGPRVPVRQATDRRVPRPDGTPEPKRLRFSFGGRRHGAQDGDTIASALAADGVDVLTHSFKYHRPRGMLCADGRCPNCMVDVDGRPNVRACVTPVTDGMRVRPQNVWPAMRADILSLTDRFDRLLPVGFYYKTFIRPRFLWPLYERVLRHAAGLGKVDPKSHPDFHQRRRNLHADVVVIGGGPAGCLAAVEAAAAGAQVILVDDQADLGGHLRVQTAEVHGDPRVAAATGREAAARLAALVAAEPRIRHLAGATAAGIYEGRLVAVSQGETLLHVRANEGHSVAAGRVRHGGDPSRRAPESGSPFVRFRGGGCPVPLRRAAAGVNLRPSSRQSGRCRRRPGRDGAGAVRWWWRGRKPDRRRAQSSGQRR